MGSKLVINSNKMLPRHYEYIQYGNKNSNKHRDTQYSTSRKGHKMGTAGLEEKGCVS